MKKFLIITLFAAVTVLFAASYVIFDTYVSSYRSETQAALSSGKHAGSYLLISINPSELYQNSSNVTWEDNNNEVVFKGKLYDVVSMENKDGKVLLSVFCDEKEEGLIKMFASSLDLSIPLSNSHPVKLIKQLLSFKFLGQNELVFDLIQTISNTFKGQDSSFDLTSVFISLEVPPPINS